MIESEPPEIWAHEIKRLHRRIAKLPNQEKLIVLYGSSSIRLWVSAKEDLAPFNVLNLGFGGSSYRWCLHYFDELFQHVKAEQMILYAGENDLSDGTSPTQVMDDLEALVHKIHEKYGKISLFILNIKPSPERTYLKNEIADLNRKLQAYCEEVQNAQYVDIHHPMLDQQANVQPRLYLSDGLHMNREGYKVWKKVLNSHLS